MKKRVFAVLVAAILFLVSVCPPIATAQTAPDNPQLTITAQNSTDTVQIGQKIRFTVGMDNIDADLSLAYDVALTPDSVGSITTHMTTDQTGVPMVQVTYQSTQAGIVKLKAKAVLNPETQQARVFEDFVAFDVKDPSQQPLLTFGTVSDLHIKAQKDTYAVDRRIQTAAKQYKTLLPDMDMIAFVGDLTHNGTSAQYRLFDRLIKTNFKKVDHLLYTMGNHEFFATKPSYDSPSISADVKALEAFRDALDLDEVYGETVIGGYQFITLSGDELWQYGNQNQDDAVVSGRQYQWLEQTLQKATDPNKPIFVFLHQAFNDTVAGSNFYQKQNHNEKVYNLLKQYPQVILFSGHSHLTGKHENSVLQHDFTMVNTASVGDVWDRNGQLPQQSQGVFTEVYADRVVIKYRDFLSQQWINAYEIKLPYTATTDHTAQVAFAQGHTPQLRLNENKTLHVEFDTADGPNLIDKYTILLNGEKVQDYFIDVMRQERVDSISLDIAWMQADAVQTVTVYATDIYNNRSQPISAQIKTPYYSRFAKVGNAVYYFDPSSLYAVTGKLELGKTIYWFGQDGAMQTGWVYERGDNWYYATQTGCLRNTWKILGGVTYYFNDYSLMQRGWINLDGQLRRFANNGALTQ